MADTYPRYPIPPPPPPLRRESYPRRGSRSPPRTSREPIVSYPYTDAPPGPSRHRPRSSFDLQRDESTISWFTNPLNVDYHEYITDRDIEWEKDLQTKLWESGYSRDLCHKIIALHRRKQLCRDSMLRNQSYLHQPYVDKIRVAVENEDVLGVGVGDRGGRGRNKGKERGHTVRQDRAAERARGNENTWQRDTRPAVHDRVVSPSYSSDYYSDSSEDRGDKRGLERRLRRVEDALRNHRYSR